MLEGHEPAPEAAPRRPEAPMGRRDAQRARDGAQPYFGPDRRRQDRGQAPVRDLSIVHARR